jgi:hypothetical protein
MNFEQTFKNMDDLLYKDSGSDSELDYIGQTSWVMFLRYLDELERDFLLEQYVKEGVAELDDAKLPDLLKLKYNALVDAKQQLGEVKSIRKAFIDFQEYLYTQSVG